MATDVKGQGNNIRVEEMADDVIAQQTSEINGCGTCSDRRPGAARPLVPVQRRA